MTKDNSIIQVQRSMVVPKGAMIDFYYIPSAACVTAMLHNYKSLTPVVECATQL
jgi:hypothetical protein